MGNPIVSLETLPKLQSLTSLLIAEIQVMFYSYFSFFFLIFHFFSCFFFSHFILSYEQTNPKISNCFGLSALKLSSLKYLRLDKNENLTSLSALASFMVNAKQAQIEHLFLQDCPRLLPASFSFNCGNAAKPLRSAFVLAFESFFEVSIFFSFVFFSNYILILLLYFFGFWQIQITRFVFHLNQWNCLY